MQRQKEEVSFEDHRKLWEIFTTDIKTYVKETTINTV